MSLDISRMLSNEIQSDLVLLCNFEIVKPHASFIVHYRSVNNCEGMYRKSGINDIYIYVPDLIPCLFF